MASEEPWVGIADIAAHLQVAKDTVYRWVDSRHTGAGKQVGEVARCDGVAPRRLSRRLALAEMPNWWRSTVASGILDTNLASRVDSRLVP